ncbi:MAG: nuclear transport factor 2 family protein [Acidobacteriota bacterium]
MISYEAIKETLNQLNNAENDPALSIEAKIAAIDALTAEDAEGWHNGAPTGGRAAAQEQERQLWRSFPMYRRDFERVVIDPPNAAVVWHIMASNEKHGIAMDLSGSSFFEFNGEARVQRYWLHFTQPEP